MKQLTSLTAQEIHEGLVNRQFSALQLITDHIKMIELQNSKINAFVTTTFDNAIQKAKSLDIKISQNKSIGLLEGVPLGIKNMFCTNGVETNACSKILKGFIPNYESVVTERLNNAGMISLGKLNMDEFSMGSASTNSFYGPVVNPCRVESKLVPGGSSGGSAAAVAANLCTISIGSDTGGSVRQPAAFCGLIGVKPTYGRCPRWGMIAFASSLDQAGVFARSVHDAAVTLQCMSGYSPKDLTSSQNQNFDVNLNIQMALDSLKGKKVGVLVQDDFQVQSCIESSFKKTQKLLTKYGAELIEVKFNNMETFLAAYYIISSAEASSNLARYDGIRYGNRIDAKTPESTYRLTRSHGFGQEVKERILMGNYVLSSEFSGKFYHKATLIREELKYKFNEVFKNIDLIISPTTPNEPFSIEKALSKEKSYSNDILTVPSSLAGLPCISIPSPQQTQDSLPVGTQVIANRFRENEMFQFSLALEHIIKINDNEAN